MDEPRTHYQVSFTSGQGLAVFVSLVVAILLAYFLGLMTGLAGSEARQAGGAAASGTPAASPAAATPGSTAEAPFPAPVLGVAGKTGAVGRLTAAPGVRPTESAPQPPTPSIQLFEDRASSEPTRPPALPTRPAAAKPSAKPSVRTAPSAEFWVQVDSLSSKDQAEARRRNMAAAGFAAVVAPGAGAKGTLYRVRVGPYLTREEAEKAREVVTRKAKVANAWIVPPGQ